MKCINCGAAVASLYTSYSRDNFRLTQCGRCLQFADRYVEFDLTIIAIDVMLLKPAVYRHLLFNRLALPKDALHIVTIKLGVILLCFDVYLSWYRAIISASTSATSSGSDIAGGTAATSSVAANSGAVYGGSMLSEYLHHAALCLTQSLALHVCIRLCAARFLHWHAGNALSTALLISSGARLLPVLMVVFDYGGAGALDGVDLVVALFYNVEAVRILLDCRYWQALALAVVGQAARRTAGVLATVLLGSYHGAGVSLLRAAASVR